MTELNEWVVNTCEDLHFQYIYNEEGVCIEFEKFSSLIAETINSRGLSDYSLIFIDIPQDRILEASTLVNYLNEDLEFGRFTFLVEMNRINYYMTSFIPDGVREEQCSAIIREMIELSLTYILKALNAISMLAETQLSAEEIYTSYLTGGKHE
ncbi:MAG TPA: hypothetical protein O0X39_06200 [Methanocorpusculum sp.]|nr:hypothetical protein [Methanocorpusculum sp.]